MAMRAVSKLFRRNASSILKGYCPHEVEFLSRLGSFSGCNGILERAYSGNSGKQTESTVNENQSLARPTGLYTPNNDVIITDISQSIKSVGPNKFAVISDGLLKSTFSDGLPHSLSEEFAFSKRNGLFMRQTILDLLLNVQSSQELIEKKREDGSASKPKKTHFLLTGLRGSGKSAALTTAVLWARSQNWLVFYVPQGRDWVHGGMYIQHKETGLWDTPIQAKQALQGFLSSHEETLKTLSIMVKDPLSLGEGPGIPPLKGGKEKVPEDGWSLADLVQFGIENPHFSVSVVVRLRAELAKVTSVPVMIAIDEYNSWFTFSQYREATGPRSTRPIHSNELRMVNAFRPMIGENVDTLSNGVMLTAFSESIGVGKLPDQLPGVPKRVRVEIPRFSIEEAKLLVSYYKSLRNSSDLPDVSKLEKLFYLTNGNGIELRRLSFL